MITPLKVRLEKGLPIYEREAEIKQTIENNQVTIIIGETGSGKTTQIPIFLREMGLGKQGCIGITEPRRIAAISVSQFVAKQIDVELGEEVGYQIRFDDYSQGNTTVKFMTDGILLREIQEDPDLEKYSVIMIDEAHERSLNIDFLLGLLKDVLKRRSDLKLIVVSATIDEQKFSRYFWNAPIVNVSGRMYPVNIVWNKEDLPSYLMTDAIVNKIVDIHTTKPAGDILVFMTGQNDISMVADALRKKGFSDMVVLPIYAALSSEEQHKIFEDYPEKRKVVIATNIAETSITIDGIVYVVDSGLVKQMSYNAKSGIQSLEVVKHSKAGCEQRQGRAGRVCEGTCFRMYTQESCLSRPDFTEPEIKRNSLASVVLTMEIIGIKDIENFDFIDPPDKKSFEKAYDVLVALGAIEKNKEGLTKIGKFMAKLPLEPHMSRMILEAWVIKARDVKEIITEEQEKDLANQGCVEGVATVCAFLSVNHIFIRPKGKESESDRAHNQFKNPFSDVLTFLNVWKQYNAQENPDIWCQDNFLRVKTLKEIVKIRQQLLSIISQSGIPLSANNDPENIMRAVAIGLAHNLFEHADRNQYHGVHSKESYAYIFPGSTLFYHTPRWLVAVNVVETTKPFARTCTTVKPEWLPLLVPEQAHFGQEFVKEYNSNSLMATIGKPVLYRNTDIYGSSEKTEETIAIINEIVSFGKARVIQANAIAQVKKDGWIRLVFEKEDSASSSFSSRNYLMAKKEGKEYSLAYFLDIEVIEGVPYYCEVYSDVLGRERVKPKFRVFSELFTDSEDMSESLKGEDLDQAVARLKQSFNR